MLALKITDLSKKYPSGIEALQHINLQVEAGDFFALLGPNGAGKSTTIGIVTSLVTKTAGAVTVFGRDLVADQLAVKADIGLVPQEINFNQFETVLDIVLNQAGYYGIPRRRALLLAEKYLTKLGLWEKRKSISRSLSGGMKRRLMIARALVHEPRMLILDEPTAGVDIEIRRATWEFLLEINQQGVTVILTTHNLEEAEYLCKGVAIINKGKILTQTTVKELLSKVKQETFILDLASKISVVPEVAGCGIQLLDNSTLEVSIAKDKNLNYLFAQLAQQNIEVSSLRNKANRLEELFLTLVNS